MATTKIWQIKDSVKRVVGYARNPDKTEFLDIAKTISYAVNDNKTDLAVGDERSLLVTSINCDGEPTEAMLTVQRVRGKLDGNVAYHAYQSFAPGEVTPKQCHEIGVKLARDLWGSHYQVVVATHMDKPTHLHNHFVINSVSFRTGQKFDCSKREYARLRARSDELCREYGLSVIEHPKGKTPRAVYEAEKQGLATKYSLMHDAVIEATGLSSSFSEFEQHLFDRGYMFNRNSGKKYATIRRLQDTKWTRIIHLGEDCSLESIDRRLDENRNTDPFHDYCDYMTEQKQTHGYYDVKKHFDEHYRRLSQMPILLALVFEFIYLMGGPNLIFPEESRVRYQPITPEMCENRRFLNSVSRQARIMCAEHLGTKEDVDAYLVSNERHIIELERKRKHLYNSIRHCTDKSKTAAVKEQIYAVSEELKPLRRNRYDMKNLLERSGVMKEMVEAEEKARRLRIYKECQLFPDDVKALGIHEAPLPEEIEAMRKAARVQRTKPTKTVTEEPKQKTDNYGYEPKPTPVKKKKDYER